MADATHTPAPEGATGVLVLADGSVIWGRGFGAEGEAVGEVCFNTAMTGYQEIMTDPSYARADRHLHLPAYRQCRRQLRGSRGRQSLARWAASSAQDVTAPEQFPRGAGLRRLDARQRPDRPFRRRHPRADPQDPHRAARPTASSPIDADGQVRRRRRCSPRRAPGPGLEGMDLAKEVSCRADVPLGGRPLGARRGLCRARADDESAARMSSPSTTAPSATSSATSPTPARG